MKHINFEFFKKNIRPKIKKRDLLIYLVLILSFSTALIIRAMPAKYGFYLNEFDPYSDYRGAEFIVNSFDNRGIFGLLDYFDWKDDMVWFPEGRDIASTSQGGLQFAGAILFLFTRNVFGINISLYDFLVLLPIFFGALTVLAIFLLVKKIGGTGAGLISSIIIATSPAIISRGNLGWFKSEPLALLLAILSMYIFLSIFNPKINTIHLIIRGILSGFLLGYANLSWGGSWYFMGIIGFLFIISPFLKINLKHVIISGSIFSTVCLLISAAFPRPGPNIILGFPGLILFLGLFFNIVAFYIKDILKPKNYMKTVFIALIFFILLGLIAINFGFITNPSERYLTAIFPFLKSGDPLVESVAEHQTPSGANFLISYWILIPFALFGAFLMLKKRNIFSVFSLIVGLSGLYIASSFSRLMIFSSIAFALLSSIGFIEIITPLFKAKPQIMLKKKLKTSGMRPEIKIIFTIIMIVLLASSVYYWRPQYDSPTSMSISALQYNPGQPQTDWLETLTWIRENTPEDAVIISWWDYGYWITVAGNRTSLADNATINSTRIARIGELFLSNETQAKDIINELRWDPNIEEYRPVYIVTLFSATKWQDENGTINCGIGGSMPYLLSLGGDEGKISWFASIPRLNVSNYVGNDGLPTINFWENTLLGKMFPMEYNIELSDNLSYQYNMPIQAGNYIIKFPEEGDSILRLAFASSFEGFAQVLLYEFCN